MQSTAISRVPVEVIREIFLLVTHLPNELGIADFKYPNDISLSGRLDFDSNNTGQTCSLQPLRTQLTQRRKLALVSHYWYQNMLEILYRTIMIRNISEISILYQLFRGSEVIANSVRRIHLSINAGRLTEKSNSNQLLEELINLCPRLALFHDASHRISFLSWSQRTRDITKHGLQYLDIRNLFIKTDFSQISTFASIVVSLQVLRVLILPSLLIISPQGLQPLSLPHLEILDIGQQILITESFVSYITGGELPRLHTLRFSHMPEPVKALAGFWKFLGHQLRTLHIDLNSFGHLEPLDRILPNLQQLILYPFGGALNQPVGFNKEHRSSNVEILEINGIGKDRRLVATHVEQAIQIGKTMPNLRILRFTQMLASAPDAQLSQMRSDIGRLAGKLVACGVQIESKIYCKDLDGNLADCSLMLGRMWSIPV